MGKLKVVLPAVKHADGTISKAPNAKYSHAQIIKDTGKKGEHGFILSDGTFAARERAAKVAKAVGEVKDPGKKLHSHELRKALKVKKA
jgi:hypothetical protein